VPVQSTEPEFVSGVDKYTVEEPLMLNAAVLAIVSPAPVRLPPDQLNWPPTVTGLEKLMVPLLKLTVSLSPGTPAGLQFVPLNQSDEAAPVQV
jgi:hypothetical protein